MHGVHDPICRLESAKQIADAAHQSRFIEFEDGGHGDLPVIDPQRYFQAITDFLGTIFDNSIQSATFDISSLRHTPTTMRQAGTKTMSLAGLASKIDHTLLKAEADRREIHRLVAEATEHGFASVCVNGRFVADVAKALYGTSVHTCAVVGFPAGCV